MKVKAIVQCCLEVEIESEKDDIDYVNELIEMSTIEDLLDYETEDSIQMIRVLSSYEIDK